MELTLFLLPVAGLVLGMPVFLVLLLSVLATLAFFMPMPATMLHQNMFGSISNYALLAVPFYLLAGELMGKGGISRRIFEWVESMGIRVPGSVGLVGPAVGGVHASISGSSPATVAAISRQIYPEMRKTGYGQSFSLGMINSVGAVSCVLPPSLNFILYGAAAEQSIAELFIAGIIPGLFSLFAIVLAVIGYAWFKGLKETSEFRWPEFLRASKRVSWSLFMPILILGSIYGGFATPTEAGGVACVYAMFVTMYVHREINWRALLRISGNAALMTSRLMVIVAAAGVFSWVLTVNGLSAALTSYVASLDMSPWQVLLMINLLLLIVGCFLDPASAILMLTPLLLPIAMDLGVDPIHFGVIMAVNLEIGMYTPPFGLNIFMTQATLNVRTIDIYRGVVPFILLHILVLMVISYVPWLSLALL